MIIFSPLFLYYENECPKPTMKIYILSRTPYKNLLILCTTNNYLGDISLAQ